MLGTAVSVAEPVYLKFLEVYEAGAHQINQVRVCLAPGGSRAVWAAQAVGCGPSPNLLGKTSMCRRARRTGPADPH